MSEQSESSPSFVKAFIPGLVVGLIVGLAIGAFVGPWLDGRGSTDVKISPKASKTPAGQRDPFPPVPAPSGDNPSSPKPADPPADKPAPTTTPAPSTAPAKPATDPTSNTPKP